MSTNEERLSALVHQYEALAGPGSAKSLLADAAKQRIARMREKEIEHNRPGLYKSWIARIERDGLSTPETIDVMQAALVSVQGERLKGVTPTVGSRAAIQLDDLLELHRHVFGEDQTRLVLGSTPKDDPEKFRQLAVSFQGRGLTVPGVKQLATTSNSKPSRTRAIYQAAIDEYFKTKSA